ncbi:hypothetical protein [Tsukamurella tyrosinosolvens]|uniref:hypothetical protein n=1 Tax=Tsukamurella tyrosinosolvens TaxID=57704 RepID=UPI00079742F0|nr:hypothetical protein [Tsukamurella tyrosinosolvens]KXP05380.1 hypothetical protein AXK59_07365 [Tsukamurella tyrosinosolvens]
MTVELHPRDYLTHEELRALADSHANGHISAGETEEPNGVAIIHALLRFKLIQPAYGARGDEKHDRYVPTGGNDLSGNQDHRAYLTTQYHRAWCEAMDWQQREPRRTDESAAIKAAAEDLDLVLPEPQNPASLGP